MGTFELTFSLLLLLIGLTLTDSFNCLYCFIFHLQRTEESGSDRKYLWNDNGLFQIPIQLIGAALGIYKSHAYSTVRVVLTVRFEFDI